MLRRWIPWKFIIKRAARAYGIIDPLTFLARIRQFSQPSEVQEPIELVRAGIAFHTRGLINTKAIQHNLDWVWPYWVERQFNPNDNSFIPRAFSFSHVNLTHRNWTAVGHPDLPIYPIVDPRGLTTPLYDGWSIDVWLISNTGEKLLPSKLDNAKQQWILSPNLAVKTSCQSGAMEIESIVQVEIDEQQPILKINASARCPQGGKLIFALRPYNPEGIQFIENISENEDQTGLLVNEESLVRFDTKADGMRFSNYHEGDVIHKLDSEDRTSEISCDVGMATGCALFSIPESQERRVQAAIPLERDSSLQHLFTTPPPPEPIVQSWQNILAKTAQLKLPDPKIQFLYDAAVRTLILLSAEDVFPGPYTYRRFWFRDACLMLNAMLATGLTERAHSVLDTFPGRQKITGYFQSQEGEWDSNGQVLWIMDRYQKITGHPLEQSWLDAVTKGADWIIRKRIKEKKNTLHQGLLPPGFSAEHLGPNDYYYWDDFWALAGLRSAARLCGLFSSKELQKKYQEEARDLEKHIFASINLIEKHRAKGGIPASPYRRLDAGAIGSMVADYPLQITPQGDERISRTADYLIENCFHKGAFFQDMIHSGMNIYLTLDLAQTLLRQGDSRYQQLAETVADLATPTGQWPEAIHPLTLGGCMGDGQHGWAAAEWLMMIRNLFVREEGDSLIIGSGVFSHWLTTEEELYFGPTKTDFGDIEVRLRKKQGKTMITINADHQEKKRQPASIIIDVPGFQKISTTSLANNEYLLEEL